MAKKYLIDGNWLICTEGTCMQRLQVGSQKTVFAHSKLVATMNDRMGGNFYCLKMIAAGTLVGAIVGAAIAASAVATGGASVAGIIGAVSTGAVAGSLSGKLLSLMPSICACLTRPGTWSSVHERVLIEKQMALMPDAKINCLLGGVVSIVLPEINIVLEALSLSECAYNKNSNYKNKNTKIPAGWTEITDLNKEFKNGINRKMIDHRSGFKARLFKNGDTYILAFAGTEFEDEEGHIDLKDATTDYKQSRGQDDKDNGQFAQAVALSNEINENVKIKNAETESNDAKLIITGHSLGGGLATISGASTGAETYTFNASGVHEQTFKDQKVDAKNTEHVQAYYSNSDILNIVQNNRTILGALFSYSKVSFLSYLGGGILLGDDVPRISGQRIGLDTGASNWFSAHGIEGSKLRETLLNEEKKNPNVRVYTEHD